MTPLPTSRIQVILALALLLLLGLADAAWFRHDAGPTRAGATDPEQVGADEVVLPERAYRALVVGMAVEPANPLRLHAAERRSARRSIHRMEEASWGVLWATARILDMLDAPRLEEFDRLQHDLRARALVARYPVPSLAEDVVAALRARDPEGRVEEPRALPPGWEPDRDEAGTYRRWLERTRSWSRRGSFIDRLREEGRTERPTTEMLDVTPREVLTVLLRIQRNPDLALAGEEAARMAGYARLLGSSDNELERSWGALHRLTVDPSRNRVKEDRKRALLGEEEPSFAQLAVLLHRAASPGGLP